SEQFNMELERLGSSISVNSTTDATVFSVQSLKKNLDKTLALLEERMLQPNFNVEDFTRVKKQWNERIINGKRQATLVANDVYNKVNYGPNHILGLSSTGTTQSIEKIKLNNIQHYYDNFISSEDARVVIVGDIKESEILPKLGFLNKLPNKSFNLPTIPPAPKVDKTKIYIVDIPRSAQTEFRVGYVTGLKYDATGEYYKAGLMNFVLGGAFNSRLNLNLREEKGWTYGARGAFTGGKQTGDYEFSSGIRGNATDSALLEIMKELKEYADKGITEEELNFMKSAIGQRDALRYETGFQKAGFIGNILDYDLPADYVDQQNNIIKNITKEEINALAKKWLTTDKMNILVVGDKAKILPGLEKLGYEIIELDVDGKPAGKKAF
ncbi:MAG: M16 family metallopeptidase, partial [Chitinophagaceae bacterium]